MRYNYRIKKFTHYSGDYYILQKRLLGFLWWYNPDNMDAHISGIYQTEEGAMQRWRERAFAKKSRVVVRMEKE